MIKNIQRKKLQKKKGSYDKTVGGLKLDKRVKKRAALKKNLVKNQV